MINSADIISQRFTKSERLRSKKKIDDLFKEGQSFLVYPFKLVWTMHPREENAPVQLAISVSKKYSKKAVDRNLIKRRIREAYRLNKSKLYQHLDGKDYQLSVIIIYVANQELKWDVVQPKIIVSLDRLIEEHAKSIERNNDWVG